MAKYLSDKNGEEVLVPNKFERDFKKTTIKLARARLKGKSDAQIAVLESRMKGLERQFKIYAKNQKERPERHRAEVTYGGVNSNGIVKGSRATKLAVGAMAASSVVGSALLVSIAGTATLATGGAAAPFLALAVMASVYSWDTVGSAVNYIKGVNKTNAAVQKEDKEFARKQKTSKEKRQTNTNRLQNNPNVSLQNGNSANVQKTSVKELENQIKELTAQINSLKEQLKKEQSAAQKEDLSGLTIVVNKGQKSDTSVKSTKKVKATNENKKQKSKSISI